jgi:RHS repeat-associated protein
MNRWFTALVVAGSVCATGALAHANNFYASQSDPGGSGGVAAGTETMGDVDPSTGAATFSYPFVTPSARGGVGIPLVLQYNHQTADGEAGAGFGLRIPEIHMTRGRWVGQAVTPSGNYQFPRETLLENRYTFGGQALVEIGLVNGAVSFPGIPANAIYFRLQREGAFLRFVFIPKPSGGTWIVQHKSGIVEEYGESLGGGYLSGNQVMLDTEDPAKPVAVRWYLTRRYDQHKDNFGNPVNLAVYRYKTLGARGLQYLSDVYDTPLPSSPNDFTTYANHTHLEYEAPDYQVWSAAIPRLAKPEMRLSHIDVATHLFVPKAAREQVRRYWFTYWPQSFQTQSSPGTYSPIVNAPVRGKSFLQSIEMEGACSNSETRSNKDDDALPAVTSCPRLPATTFTFTPRGTINKGTTVLYPPKPNASSDPRFRQRAPGLDQSAMAFFPDVNRTLFVDYDRDGLPDLVSAWGGDLRAFHNRRDKNIAGDLGFQMACVRNYAAMPLDLLKPEFGVSAVGYWGAAAGVSNIQRLGNASNLTWSRFAASPSASGYPCPEWPDATGSPVMELVSGAYVSTIGGPTTPAIVTDFDADGFPDRAVFKSGRSEISFSRRARGSNTISPFVETAYSNVYLKPGDPSVGPDYGTILMFADLNGDGIPDAITGLAGSNSATSTDLVFVDGRGTGKFECISPVCTAPSDRIQTATGSALGRTPSTIGGFLWSQFKFAVQDDNPHTMFMPPTFHDVNGDGLADAIQVIPAGNGNWAVKVLVWLNEDGQTFRQVYNADVYAPDANTPSNSPGMYGVRFADTNGDGTDELLILWRTSVSALNFNYQTPYHVAPGLLTMIDNGMGASTEFTYTSLQQVSRTGWVHNSPQNGYVVTKTFSKPNNRVVAYSYRDPAYDSWKRSLLGFRHVTREFYGSVTETDYLYGHCQENDGCSETSDNDYELAELGTPYRSVKKHSDGRALSETLWFRERRELYNTGSRSIWFSPVKREEINVFANGSTPAGAPISVTVVDNTASPSHEAIPTNTTVTYTPAGTYGTRIVHEMDTDFEGNTVAMRDFGSVNFSTGAPLDEVITTKTKYLTSQNGWTFRAFERSLTGSSGVSKPRTSASVFDTTGDVVEERAYLSGTEALDRHHVSGAAVAPLPATAAVNDWVSLQTYLRDITGAVVKTYGPVELLPGGTTGQTLTYTDYDPYQVLVVRSRSSSNYAGRSGNAFETTRTYNRGFGTPLSVSHPNGTVDKVTLDEFGRPSRIYQGDLAFAGGTNPTPVQKMTYEITAVYPIQRVLREDLVTGGLYKQHFDYFDGHGQKRLQVDQADTTAGDAAPWIVSGQNYGADGELWYSCRPVFYTGDPRTVPLTTFGPCTGYMYDSFVRLTEVQDDWLSSSPKTLFKKQYDGLTEYSFDANTIDPAGPHKDNYRTVIRDGHGNVFRTIKRVKSSTGVWDDIYTTMSHGTTGEITQSFEQHAGGGEYTNKSYTYDSFGRLQSTNDPSQPGSARYRYAYDNANRLVATSDLRGCGQNLHYDALGRLIARDFSPCTTTQDAYTAPDLVTGDGTESFNVYDTPEVGEDASQYNNQAGQLYGRLVANYERGAHGRIGYDSRGNAVLAYRRIAKPTVTTANALSARYTGFWFRKQSSFDVAGRLAREDTGADLYELRDSTGAAATDFVYSKRGTIKSVSGSFGTLIASNKLDALGRPIQTVYGDAAATKADFTYDSLERLGTFKLSRTAPAFWTAAAIAPYTLPGLKTTAQKILTQTAMFYDPASNPTSIEDLSAFAEWPAGAAPMRKLMTYDALYRVTNTAYAYKASTTWGDAPRTSSIAYETGIGDTRPVPERTLTTRVRSQTNAYDWLGTTTETSDPGNALFDRSLGPIMNQQTRLETAGAGAGVAAKYDEGGNMVDLTVRRTGTCTRGLCIQRYGYEWDEIGQLVRARRWDYGTLPTTEPVYPAYPSRAADWELRYSYAAGRVRKTSINPSGETRHTIEVFPSLRLNRAQFLASGEYERTPATETLYLGKMARVVYAATGMPIRAAADKRHVFFQIGDTLGSTSVVFDKQTSELVEKVSYDAWGRTESDYRPARWAGFREDYRFTEKEEDVEVGLTYFGARYYSAYLGRWLSPDPLQTHAGGSDPNTYAYVSGQHAQATDPLGLQCREVGSSNNNGTSVTVSDCNGQSAASYLAESRVSFDGASPVQGFPVDKNMWPELADYSLSMMTKSFFNEYSSIRWLTFPTLGGLPGLAAAWFWPVANTDVLTDGEADSKAIGTAAAIVAGLVGPIEAEGAKIAVTELRGAGSTTTFEILDGVRRAKAAEQLGQTTIRAHFEEGGKIMNIDVSALRSPFKDVIEVNSVQRMTRWLDVLGPTRDGVRMDPILIQTGSNGVPINLIRFKF